MSDESFETENNARNEKGPDQSSIHQEEKGDEPRDNSELAGDKEGETNLQNDQNTNNKMTNFLKGKNFYRKDNIKESSDDSNVDRKVKNGLQDMDVEDLEENIDA